jgi:ParB-like chromosome segregation protein Spo0J
MIDIEYKKTDKLIPYVNNSRTHDDAQVSQIAASIKEFGFTNPLLIDSEGGIIAGHGRLMAAKKLGMDEVPTIMLDGLSDAQKKAYVIADNKLALNAGWDMDLLAVEIEQLKELDFDIDLLGFNIDELDVEFDFSEKNKELDLDSFNDEMELRFKVSKEQFEFITEKLRVINGSMEIAFLQVLGYES